MCTSASLPWGITVELRKQTLADSVRLATTNMKHPSLDLCSFFGSLQLLGDLWLSFDGSCKAVSIPTHRKKGVLEIR